MTGKFGLVHIGERTSIDQMYRGYKAGEPLRGTIRENTRTSDWHAVILKAGRHKSRYFGDGMAAVRWLARMQ